MDAHQRHNIEFKIRLDEVPRAEASLRTLGAAKAGTLVQRDTYFRVASGRLKLREMPDRAELIAYDRNETHSEMESRYTLTPIEHPSSTRQALAERHGIRGVVEKSRSLWLYKNARIHIDHVGGLGTFLEIEVVEPRTPTEGRVVLNELIAELSLDSKDAIQASYIDLLDDVGGLPSPPTPLPPERARGA
jgi:predicted adenylyl cyclase CyaB